MKSHLYAERCSRKRKNKKGKSALGLQTIYIFIPLLIIHIGSLKNVGN